MRSTDRLRGKLPEIEEKIGYTFNQSSLLELAFIHCSFANENRGMAKGNNERLEFLGDAVLGLIISDFLYLELPDKSEGSLSYLRSRLVEASTCSFYVEKMGLKEHILMGKGEKMNEGKGRITIVSDFFEALIGAIYLDGGMEVARRLFLDHFRQDVLEIIKSPTRNWKAEIQDYCQKNYRQPPTYEVVKAEGPDHDKTFYIAVKLNHQILGEGEGPSKKEAEQKGAQRAIEDLEKM